MITTKIKCIFCTRDIYRKKTIKVNIKGVESLACSSCIREITNISLRKGFMCCLVCNKDITNKFANKHNNSKLHIKNVLRGIKL